MPQKAGAGKRRSGTLPGGGENDLKAPGVFNAERAYDVHRKPFSVENDVPEDPCNR